MSYQSPLHILKSLNIDPNNLVLEDINRLRKKILAEFSLSTDIKIEINERFYSKDEVLKIIDQLKDIDNLQLQKEIFKTKSVLNWLENPNKYVLPKDLLNDLLNSYDLNKWFQNIIQEATLEYVKLNFKKKLFEKNKIALDLLNSLDEEYRYQVYDYIYLEIQQVIEEIVKTLNSGKIKFHKTSLGFMLSPIWSNFLNNLPNYFEAIRNNYCWTITDYISTIANKDKEWAYEISAQLCQINCDDSIKKDILYNHTILSDNYKSKKAIYKFFGLIVFFIVFFISITRIISPKDDSSSSSTYTRPEPPRYETPRNYDEVQKIKVPANSYYILQIQKYQKALLKNDVEKGGKIINGLNGQDLVSNLNIGNLEEYTDTQNKNNPQMVSIKNETDYEMIVFKAGCNANRSYFLHHNNSFDLECCEGDVLFFYFGKKWKRVSLIANKQEFDEKMRFQGYFAKTHNNSLATFMKQYTITANRANSSIIYNNSILKKGVFPTTKNIELRENDSSVLLLNQIQK